MPQRWGARTTSTIDFGEALDQILCSENNSPAIFAATRSRSGRNSRGDGTVSHPLGQPNTTLTGKINTVLYRSRTPNVLYIFGRRPHNGRTFFLSCTPATCIGALPAIVHVDVIIHVCMLRNRLLENRVDRQPLRSSEGMHIIVFFLYDAYHDL